jgi:polysaccharide export outer membrane protein
MQSSPLRCALLFVVLVLASAPSANAQGGRAGGPPQPPPAGGVVPTDYVIGSEDVLGIVFWRETEMSGDVTVRPDGRITLPLIGDIMAAGLRPDVLRDQIDKAATRYITDPNVSVIVRMINSRKVFITGEVMMPGEYPLVGPRTVMQLIAVAGGLTEFADQGGITVMRTVDGQSRSFRFNYKDVAKGKNLQQNIPLLPGDTVVVP